MTLIAPWQDDSVVQWTQNLIWSYQYWLDKPLIDTTGTLSEQSQELFMAPFAVLSHGTEIDPILNYGNQLALNLWEMPWHEFIQMPSRLTAEPDEQEERAKTRRQLSTQGFISNYQGVRISKTGRRFRLDNVIVWNVVLPGGDRLGQAACFTEWQSLETGSEALD